MEDEHVLSLVVPYLTLEALWVLRQVSSSCKHASEEYTRELHLTTSSQLVALYDLAKAFPFVQRLSVMNVLSLVDATELREALSSALPRWHRLTWVHMTQVLHLQDDHIHILTRASPQLEHLSIHECYQVSAPTIIGRKLRSVSIKHCVLNEIGDGTEWPELEELTLSSRLLSTEATRRLMHQLQSTRLKELHLLRCSEVQVLEIQGEELPFLQVLRMEGCLKLRYVHVISASLVLANFSMCSHTTHVRLDARDTLRHVDLSFLQSLTDLDVKARELQWLDLRNCERLERDNCALECGDVEYLLLQGAKLRPEDLGKAKVASG